MSRIIISLVFLFLLTSCATSKTAHEQIIPEQKITSKPAEAIVVDDGKLNIAILVPLSKQKEQTGQFLIKSAQLALIDSNNPNINLIPIDSDMVNNNPHLLITQLEEHRVKAILGPVYGPETEKLSLLLKDKDITVLSLSNDSSITGDSLLMLGISPDSQANILTRYAISQGVSHFYLLLPSTKYGKLIDNIVTDIVTTKDNTTHTVSWYSTENVDQVMDEFVESIKNEDHKTKAIFMPQGGRNLTQLNLALQKHGITIRLIGSQAWDHSNILSFPSFDGAILLRHKLSNEKFYHDFHKFFHTKPNNLDLITYNGLLMLSNMEKNKLPITKQSIIDNNQDFDKYSEVKFTPQGLSLYKMSVVEVHSGQFKTMENPQ